MVTEHKLTVSRVLEIRRMLDERRASHSRIASVSGVCKSSITDINTRKNWGWVPDLDPDDLPLIQALSDGGMDYREIAAKFDSSITGMQKLIKQLARENK